MHELLDNRAAAAFLGISPNTLHVWRCEKRFPIPYIKIGAKVCYRREVLEDFLKSREVNP